MKREKRFLNQKKNWILMIFRIFQLDPHVVLDFLDAGDKLFLDSETSKKAYAILKLYFLCRNRKSKLEVGDFPPGKLKTRRKFHFFQCFSCGCVQKYFIELYKDGTRLHEALNCLIKSKLSDSPTIIERKPEKVSIFLNFLIVFF